MRLKAFFVAIAFLAPVSSQALAGQVESVAWSVEGKLVGKEGGKAKDISGIACSMTSGFPRSCLTIDDNVQSAQEIGTVRSSRPQPFKVVYGC
ncbi:hypothetical protein FHT97_006371 [Rhizobium sp. BK399]|uniref:hypothetical protein n=1 Tax=Rhizobium sp. BK181 TaxID=2587072 RepID=UPI00160D98A7|nr:hypothetical protein [Rhizobium sp. BK181]MBB3320462.1 hypothetical protein [Rhizobium sp. BK181]MBB3545592.1 hypothetical protein [Rhizobium sp. BK399]